MKYTDHEINEIIKCRDDISYFADNYIKIMNPTLGITQLKLNKFQHDAIQKYNTERIFFMPTGRQEGKTTIASVILLHQSIFGNSDTSIIFAWDKSSSNDILAIIKCMYELLPDYLKIAKIVSNTKGKLDFDNLCSIISAGKDVNYSRGRSISNIYVDESEYIDNIQEIIKGVQPIYNKQAKFFAFSSLRMDAMVTRLSM